MTSKQRSSESGQSAVLVALLLVALLGLLALALDGGYALLQRRQAQNAADAGALAGAHELCLTGSSSAAVEQALDYAVDRNRADEAEATSASGIVTVTTTIPFSTWFGGVFGQPELTARAQAAAGCFTPAAATHVLPVAWACHPFEGTPDETIENTECKVSFDHTYIIMDSFKTAQDIPCQLPPNSGNPPGAVDCDFDNDGLNDFIAGGDRSWLDLDGGGGGAADLMSWITNGFPGEVRVHTWLGGLTGTDTSIFQAARDRTGAIVILPVYDSYCDQPGKLPQTSCAGLYHTGTDTTVAGGGAAAFYYHIISFAAFRIDCVSTKNPEKCPAKNAGIAAGVLANNTKTIEGQFVTGFDPDVSGYPNDGADAGVFTVYLIH